MGRGNLKDASEVIGMRDAGRIAAIVLRRAFGLISPGLAAFDLDESVGEIISDHGAESAFFGYRKFPRQCCISVNETVVHGIGGRRRFQFGDIVKLDIGVKYNGFVGDVAMSIAVGGCCPAAQKLMDVTSQALYKGISAARADCRVVEISRAIQQHVERAGFSVVREFVGHGVGRALHENPQIPNYVDVRNNDRLKAGMTIAIEPMVNAGTAVVEVLDDGWTVVTKDRQLSAHFEHTVLITDGEAEILTRDGLPALY